MKIDMSPDAITRRMLALDQLWELSMALRSSKVLGSPISDRDTAHPGLSIIDSPSIDQTNLSLSQTNGVKRDHNF